MQYDDIEMEVQMEHRDNKISELQLELKILTRAYNELFKLHYGYEPDTKEVIGHVK